ncbi:MAG TPA: lipid-A-disaccharide synthase, partial [Burkholderiaceae bacterium]|nr:lipid-A-disaccharide synthase [Burkholderiaceae bacterium]
LEPLLAQAPGVPLELIDGRSHEVLAACDVTLIASGTATLEAALFKRPMVIAYRMNALSWQIMSRMRLQPWIGLPNILSGEFVVPEFLQGDATPEALSHAVLQWLDSPQRCDAIAARFLDIHQLLRRDTARTATDAIARILAR